LHELTKVRFLGGRQKEIEEKGGNELFGGNIGGVSSGEKGSSFQDNLKAMEQKNVYWFSRISFS
jgi:hypothetical protein